MNDLEARRRLMADPHHLPPELQEAVARDPHLAALRAELVANDELLRGALTATPVPEGLADRIVLHARYGTRSRQRLAIAAAVAALAVAVSMVVEMRGSDPEQSRELAMMEHVATSRDEAANRGPVDAPALKASVAALGVDVRAGGYRVAQLGRCVIAGVESRHFILQTKSGAASYVVLPGAPASAPPERELTRYGLEGLFVQRDGATIGVFAPQGTSPRELRAMLHEVVG